MFSALRTAIKNCRVLNLALPPTPTVPLGSGHLGFPSYKTGGKTLRFTYLSVIKGHVILKHFEEEEKLPISSWHHVFHLGESQLPTSLAQEGLCIYQVAEPKKPISGFTRASGNKEGCPGTDSASLVQKENQAKPRKVLLPFCSEVITDPPETQRVRVHSYSRGFGSKICKHSSH